MAQQFSGDVFPCTKDQQNRLQVRTSASQNVLLKRHDQLGGVEARVVPEHYALHLLGAALVPRQRMLREPPLVLLRPNELLHGRRLSALQLCLSRPLHRLQLRLRGLPCRLLLVQLLPQRHVVALPRHQLLLQVQRVAGGEGRVVRGLRMPLLPPECTHKQCDSGPVRKYTFGRTICFARIPGALPRSSTRRRRRASTPRACPPSTA
ncbi:hypothetical protein D1007_41789 [Hordeum vulgare]|nr:hypothetical protein D1007_41789 [Hordeum vulgare]